MQKTLFSCLLVMLSSPLWAEPKIRVEQLPCLQVGDNGVAMSTVEDDVPGSVVRLYFRRLHEEVEDFYWVEARSRGGGEYWAVLPKPADEVLERREIQALEEEIRERWARWWRVKETEADRDPNDDLDQDLIRERASLGRELGRDWMGNLTDPQLEEWLQDLEYEPTEYYASLMDGSGEELARSPLQITPVRSSCPTNLSAQQAGLGENLTVGETASWQRGEEVFHWLCDGVVSRIGPDGVWRGDEACRACVIAWWKNKSFLIPLAAGATGTGVVLLEDEEPREVSPARP